MKPWPTIASGVEVITRLIDAKPTIADKRRDDERGLARDDGERPARARGGRDARRRRNVKKREPDGADDVQHDDREVRAGVRHAGERSRCRAHDLGTEQRAQ